MLKGQQLALVVTVDFPEPARDPAISNLLAFLLTHERDGQGARILTELPSNDERQRLSARLAKLDASLCPAQPARVVPIFAQMMLSFSSSRLDDPEERAASYVEVLAPLPQWAIEKACMRF